MGRLARVRCRSIVLCVAGGIVGLASQAGADPIVSASYIRPGFEVSTVFGDTTERALSQTFVVNDTGTLEQIEVLLFAAAPGTLTMELHAAIDGAPVDRRWRQRRCHRPSFPKGVVFRSRRLWPSAISMRG